MFGVLESRKDVEGSLFLVGDLKSKESGSILVAEEAEIPKTGKSVLTFLRSVKTRVAISRRHLDKRKSTKKVINLLYLF